MSEVKLTTADIEHCEEIGKAVLADHVRQKEEEAAQDAKTAERIAEKILFDLLQHTTQQNASAPASPNDKYKAEYAVNPHLAARMSEGEYIQSRRIDEGLDKFTAVQHELTPPDSMQSPLVGDGRSPFGIGSDLI